MSKILAKIINFYKKPPYTEIIYLIFVGLKSDYNGRATVKAVPLPGWLST
jgi:hypothetical protein